MTHRGRLVLLPPNRVWRSYPGGKTLDRLEGAVQPADSHLAEDWIGSVTEAAFAGREHLHEGISRALVGGKSFDWRELLRSDPEYFLGAEHVRRFGPEPMVLVKFLDSAIRLNFQAHPSREFARKFLGANAGKTEAYYILGSRSEVPEPYIYVGFQRPPAREDMKRMVEAQDMAALERCFDRIPVRPGDRFVIPAGAPHALGEGLFLVEIQEPSDLVARFEFERGGYVLPEKARFMGRGIDLCLDFTDFQAHSREDIERRSRDGNFHLEKLGPEAWRREIIGPSRTDCFRVDRWDLKSMARRPAGDFCIAIVTQGAVVAEAGGETHRFKTYDRFVVPAGLEGLMLRPVGGPAEILECSGPK